MRSFHISGNEPSCKLLCFGEPTCTFELQKQYSALSNEDIDEICSEEYI